MAKKNKNRNKSGFQITPSMIFLNLSIILFVFIVCFFIYNVNKNELEVISDNKSSSSQQGTSSGENGDNSSGGNAADFDKEFFKSDLFIGDSILTGLSKYGFLDKAQVWAKEGLNPDNVLATKIGDNDIISQITEKKPKNIYIMLGTDGMATLSASHMNEKMTSLIDEIKNASDASKIVVISMPPIASNAENLENGLTIPKIKEYNRLIKKLAETADLTYIDVYTLLENDEGYMDSEYAEQDGVHFMGKAFQVILSHLESNVK